jgi:DNA-binding MarR family transcriptional regulator
VDISITEKGLATLKKVDAEQGDWALMTKRISKAEAVELNRLLDKLRG